MSRTEIEKTARQTSPIDVATPMCSDFDFTQTGLLIYIVA